MSHKKCCCATGCTDPNCEEGNCDAVLADCGTLGPLGFSVEIELTCRPASCSKYEPGPGGDCDRGDPALPVGARSGCLRGGPGWEGTIYEDCPAQAIVYPSDGGQYPTWLCTPANPLRQNAQARFQWATHWMGNSFECPPGHGESACIAVDQVKDHGNAAKEFGAIAVAKTISATVGWVNGPCPDSSTDPVSTLNFADLRESHGVFGKPCGVCVAGANVCCDPLITNTPCACDCHGGGKTNYQLLSPTNDPHIGLVYGRIAWFSPCTGPSTPGRAPMWCGGGCTDDTTHRSSMFCLEILATFAVSFNPEDVPYAICPDLATAITEGPGGVYYIQLPQGSLLGTEDDGLVWVYEQRHVWVMFKHCNDHYTGTGNKCRMQLGDYIPIRTGICTSDIYFPKGCCNYPYEICEPPCNPPEVECACSPGILDLMRRAGWDFTKVRVG